MAKHVASDADSAPATKHLTIRVYLYPQGGKWYAAAPDYVLMAQGDSQREAAERFMGAAKAYFDTALEHGWLDALNRRPKLFRRLEIRARWRIAWLLHRRPLKTHQLMHFA